MNEGTPVKHVSIGDRSLGRESITVGSTDVPVRFYRVSDPPLFAGFQIDWIDGDEEETGATFNIASGAGLGSKYMTLQVEIPGHGTVYEYVDIAEVLQQRVADILDEVTGDDKT